MDGVPLHDVDLLIASEWVLDQGVRFEKAREGEEVRDRSVCRIQGNNERGEIVIEDQKRRRLGISSIVKSSTWPCSTDLSYSSVHNGSCLLPYICHSGFERVLLFFGGFLGPEEAGEPHNRMSKSGPRPPRLGCG